MAKLHDFIFDQGIVGVIGCVLAGLSGIIGGILYATTAANVFNPDISGALVALFVISGVVSFGNLFLRLKEGRAVSIILAILCLIYYGGTQANYLANLFVAIDPTPVTASLVFMFIFSILALLASIVGFIFLREKDSNTRVSIDERK